MVNRGALGVAGVEIDFDKDWEKEFEGTVLTAPGGDLGWAMTEEHQKIIAIFSTGLVLVGVDYRGSGLVKGALDHAARHFRARGEVDKLQAPAFVELDTIKAAYRWAGHHQALDSRRSAAKFKKVIEDYLETAAAKSASDIHIECTKSGTLIQNGIANDLIVFKRLLEEEGRAMIGVIFYNGDNQSGVISSDMEPRHSNLESAPGNPEAIRLPPGVDGIRCEFLPLVGGLYLVMRLNYGGSKLLGNAMMDLADLGLAPEQIAIWRRSYRRPGGVRIISGPTNTGKSTTLRLVLNKLLAELKYRKNCLILEDPPEGGIKGGRQVFIPAAEDEEKQQKIMDKIFRSLLRVAPDIFFLGEIRDFLSGSFCLRLSLIGKRIFTTTHVDRALKIPVRLVDLGLDPSLIFDPDRIVLFASQRLVRCMCPSCRVHIVEAAVKDPLIMEQMRRLAFALHKMEEHRYTRGSMSGRDLAPPEFPDLSRVFVPAESVVCKETVPCDLGRLEQRTVTAEVIEPDYELMHLLKEGKHKEAGEYWLSADGLNGLSMRWHALMKIRDGLVALADVEEEIGPVADEIEVERFFAFGNEEFVARFDALFQMKEAAE